MWTAVNFGEEWIKEYMLNDRVIIESEILCLAISPLVDQLALFRLGYLRTNKI
jgi:hypothetical protein